MAPQRLKFLTTALATAAAAIALTGSSAICQPRMQLTYLANMGVLLESGGKRIVIDGFHHGELADYASVLPATLQALEQSREPFRSLDAMLTTHRHRDHFNAASVANRLRSDSAIVFVAARETVDSLFAREPNIANHPRVRATVAAAHSEERMQVRGIDISVIDLPHNPTPSQGVANVGFVIQLGTLRVLHVGDGFATATNFSAHNLATRKIDIAMVPFWYFMGDNANVLTAINARTWVATHVPPADTADVRRKLQMSHPKVIVLTTPGQRQQFQ